MSENETPGTPNPGGWQPTPQGGEYDAEATAFVHLPEGMTDFGAYGDPLAAPGHDYVPPRIPAATDPAATGAWSAAPGETRWPQPESAQPHDAGATGQWSFDTAPEPTPPVASELTGQWTIPVARGDLPDESGEFTTSALASDWNTGRPPATLPGGAPAPWADTAEAAPTLPGGAAAPWATQPPAGPEQADPPPHDFPAHPAQGFEPQPEPAAQEAAEAAPQHLAGPAADEPGRPSQGTGYDHPEETGVPEGQAPEDRPRPGADQEAPEAAAPGGDGQAAPEDAHSEHPHASYVLRVNGADRPVTDAWIGESLLYVLRERLGLAGAKDGCSQGECGACAVQVDGRLVASCLVPAATAAGSEVRTVEGLATDGEPSDVQRALANCGAVQCGFCVPGMAMTVHDLLEGNHAPSDLETRQALCGNLCRCSGYRGVLEAVREVVAEREANAAAEEARIPHQAPPGAGGVHPHPHGNPHEHPHDGGMA
ncbi:2Fe-2S iron-sulfur cluster-binding protein [Streptomyces albidochromogenes]|uniref:2Fe-2S iron-sulfur cluster-binding protein n=1 Tax=Streptomyces albidochromogenes TaxID=329524 RepID=A0ABW6FPX5_9ACTN